jgi:hypothetical protein
VLPAASIRHAVVALALGAGLLLPSSAAAFQRGFVLTGWGAGSYLSSSSDGKVRKMANDGSSNAAVFTQWFMDAPTSSHIAPDATRTPSDQSILHAIETARAAGMDVTVKPQVGIRTGSWIGAAHPGDLDAFWADYRSMLLHYADLAQQAGASMLVIGTEMGTLSGDETRWRALIADLRVHFSGQLTYAANYDEFQRVPFWDALDYIGIDAYFGLADDADPAPPVEALTAAWSERGFLGRIAAASARTGRKVLFTEIGYRGIHATAAHPNIWQGTQVTDTQAQANAYEAFYRAVSERPWMAGVYWWEVNADSWWVQDYSPLAKPAEQIMVEWNKRLAPPPPEDPPVVTPDPPVVTPEPPVVTPDPPVVTPDPPVVTPEPPKVTPEPPVVTPAGHTPAVPAARPVIYMIVRGQRLLGAVAPYSAGCKGTVGLRVRIKRGRKWRYLRTPAPLTLTRAGGFARRMPAGPVRVKAVYSSSCAKASSAWIASS